MTVKDFLINSGLVIVDVFETDCSNLKQYSKLVI